MINYLKLMGTTLLYSIGGTFLISLVVDPKENDLLCRALVIGWTILVYCKYTFPVWAELRQEEIKPEDNPNDP